MNITIKNIFILLGATSLVLSSLFVWAVWDLATKNQTLKSIEHKQFLMFKKSDELRQSSDDLTRYARTYANTLNETYKDTYFHILDIRNGIAKKPNDYSSVYWSLLEPKRSQRYPLNKPSSLKSEIKKLPYLASEFKQLETSEFYSNELVKLEIEAFQAIDGLFKDPQGNYTIQKKPNQKWAISLLTSKKYHLAKEKVVLPIDDFLRSLSNRKTKAIEQQKQMISLAFQRIFIFLFFSLLGLVIVAIIIKKRILSPINSLSESINSFKNDTPTTKENFYFDDEIGLMAKSFFDMKATIDDDLKRLDFALGAGRQGWFDLDLKTGDFIVSDEYAKILGYAPEKFKTNLEIWKKNIHPNDREETFAAVQRCIETKEPVEHEYRRKNRKGNWVWLHSVGEVVQSDRDDNPIRIIGVNTDITERKQHEFREKIRIQVMELLVKTAPLNIILKSILEIIEQVNPNIICSIMLLDKKGKYLLTGASLNLPEFYNETIHGAEIGPNVGSCGRAAFTRKRVISENIQTDPHWKIFQTLANKANLASCCSDPIIGTQSKLLGTFVIYHQKPRALIQDDFNLIDFVLPLIAIAIDRSQINEKMSLSDRVFNDTHEGITITDSQGLIVDVNPAYCKITGYKREEVIGQNPSIISSGKQPPKFYAEMWQSIKEHNYWQGEVWNRKKDGELYAELLSISALKDNDDNVLYYVGLFSDITTHKKQQEKLNLMAHYDVLTQLPNRTLFADRFHQAIAHSKRTNTQLAICFLDLDNFKHINDNFGHEVGDQLLVEVAKRILENIRDEDTVSRQGGDEFALLLGNIESYTQCEQTLKRIHYSLSQPYLIGGNSHKVTASSGITLYPNDNGDIDTLLRHADQAMYQAKLSGKHRYHLFSPEQNQQTIHKHSKLEKIQYALENDELQLYYQPKVNMKTGNVFGAEALIRWLHPKEGLIPPLAFLPTIEGTELELKVGNWVINRALTQLSHWQKQGIKMEISVNISSHHLQSASFIALLDQALAQHPTIKPSDLQLEILESSALSNLEEITKIVNLCRQTIGVNIALDDFGTGYSSLTHLRNLSANTIKIDQTFVRDILDDPSDYAITDGIIGLADSFNRDIIAEGVETIEQGLMLLQMGCENAQGYGIARPMPSHEIPSWLKQYEANEPWISYGHKKQTRKEKNLSIFNLTSTQWLKRFKTKMSTSVKQREDWPIMDKTKCPCGTWIRRAQQEPLFEKTSLDSLYEAHDKLHFIANKLQLNHQHDHSNLTPAELSELQITFDKMSAFLDAMH